MSSWFLPASMPNSAYHVATLPEFVLAPALRSCQRCIESVAQRDVSVTWLLGQARGCTHAKTEIVFSEHATFYFSFIYY